MNGHRIVTSLPTKVVSAVPLGWIDRVAAHVTRLAARSAPQSLSERLEEEWSADLAQQRGRMSQLSFAFGCYWAAAVIRHGHCTAKAPATSPPMEYKTMTAYVGAPSWISWNGTAVAGLEQLESYLYGEARKNPQPEIHLRADRRVKYDYVAKVLAAAQHNHMQKMGFVNTSEFKD